MNKSSVYKIEIFTMETTAVTNVPTELVTDVPETEGLWENYTLADAVGNHTSINQQWPELPLRVFEVFIIIEIVMLIVELLLSFGIAVKMKQWRRNYRNQMLTQISAARFIKRIIGYAIFLEKKSATREEQPSILNLSLIIYINLVTILLVYFLIKHMNDTLIVVFIKIRKNNLYTISLFAWLFPILLTCIWIAVIRFGDLNIWLVDFLFCLLFKWSFTVVGTIMYICILHRIKQDEFRQFARGLAVITFMLCLTINLYMVFADVSRLFRCFLINVMKYVFGFILNCLVLCLYVTLVSSNFSHRVKHCDALSNHSAGATNGEETETYQKYSTKNDTKFEINLKCKSLFI